jgi:hypothetical protein
MEAYEYEYIHENGKWRFHRGGGSPFESDTVAILFDQGDPFDVLLKHGPADQIERLFLGDKCDKLAKAGCNLIMVPVPPRCVETLNKCLAISASKWCSRLLDEANAQISGGSPSVEADCSASDGGGK